MAQDQHKLHEIGEKPFKAQAIWFLNAFWTDFGEREAERIWAYAHKMAELDTQRKADGNALDEFMCHHFLEQCKETLTVLQMREHLRNVGIEKVKLVPLIHYLIFRYRVDWHYLVNAPQGDPEEIAKAQRLLDAVKAAFDDAQARADDAKAAEHEAVSRENDAKRDEAEAKRTEAEASARAADARAAQQELEAALAELQAQERAYNNKTEELKRKSEEGSVVQRNKAKNELAQHLSEDPLPLRKAKITQEAAVKKAERAAKAAQEAADQAAAARQAAERARQEAEKARRAAEQARQAAEAAVEEAQRKVEEAEAYFEEVKKMAGGGKGALWWLDRELHEAKAYMPTSKGGYKKEKGAPF